MRSVGILGAIGAVAMIALSPIASALAEERDFFNPTWRGYRLDYSYYVVNATHGPSPGSGPAHAFCRAMGLGAATFWDVDSTSSRYTSIHIGNGNLCTTIGATCRGYRVIRCAGGGAAVTPPGPARGAYEFDTNRPGGDLWWGNIAGNHEECHRWCNRDLRCRSFTWVKPGIQGASARCWIKNTIPAPQVNGCCVSGVVR